MPNRQLLVIDTETGGLDPAKYSILSLGAVVWREGKLEDQFEVFVAEPQPVFEAEAMSVNRIDVDWLRLNGVDPKEAIERFHLFLRKNFGTFPPTERISIAGHNVNFDVGFLKRLYAFTTYNYSDIFSHRLLDTAGILRFLSISGKLDLNTASLDEAIEYFKINIDDSQRHTALGDAIATAQVLNYMIELVK
jgi:DNA polymerase III epsilon subunit-like protein